MPNRRLPADLGARGRRLWRRVVLTYEPSDAEYELLTEAARCVDRLDALRAVLATEPVLVEGSRGQMIVHPAIVEERAQRDLLGRLLGRLSFPSESDTEAAAATLGKRGAQARWKGAHPRA